MNVSRATRLYALPRVDRRGIEKIKNLLSRSMSGARRGCRRKSLMASSFTGGCVVFIFCVRSYVLVGVILIEKCSKIPPKYLKYRIILNARENIGAFTFPTLVTCTFCILHSNHSSRAGVATAQ